MRFWGRLIVFLLLSSVCAAAPLTLTPDAHGFPAGWSRYGRGSVAIEFKDGFLRVADRSDIHEQGICRVFHDPVPGKYQIVLEARGDFTRSQMVVIPEGGRRQVVNMTGVARDFQKYSIGYEVPAGCRKVFFYLFGLYRETPDIQIKRLDLEPVKTFSPEVLQIRKAQSSGPPPPVTRLKNLYLTTPLSKALIVPGNSAALQEAAKELAARFGGRIASADQISLPLSSHVIALGHRGNNRLIDQLYRRGFCYTDLVYPGPGGHELRSIHNPVGGGFNVILCGGSEDAGAVKAARLLAGGEETAGFLMDVHFPAFRKELDPCDPDLYFQTRAGGYYGWNLISGMMALFYQTGDTFYAKEFLRLAFPDEQGRKELQRYNPESFDLLHDPLSGPYHYLGHQMILLWDLIEEHPFFTDAQRLAITNAFLRQRQHHLRDTRPVGRFRYVSSRHSQWGQICNYALARYFSRDYPDPAWTESLRRAEAEFSLAHFKEGWILGEGGIPDWFISGSIQPAAHFFALSGDPGFEPEGAWANALRFMETQWDGSSRCKVLSGAGRQVFHRVAEQTKDGKYLWYAELLPPYPRDKYKLGASFSPTGKLAPRPPTELLRNWTLAPMKKAEHLFYGVREPLEKCYLGVSWRDTLDMTGDWISFNCFNEKYRTPFKLLSLYGLRLDGHWLLSGFGNYVQPVRGGITDKAIPTVGQVYGTGKAGDAVFFAGGVPKHAFSAWRRDLLLVPRTFVLLADTITPAEKSPLDLACMIHLQAPGSIIPAPGRKNQIIFTSTHTASAIPVKQMQYKGAPACTITSGPRMVVFRTQKTGDRAVITFRVPRETVCLPELQLFDHNTRAGALNVYLDGKMVKSGVPHFSGSSQLAARIVKLGRTVLAPGDHTIELEVAAITNQASSNWIAAGSLALTPVSRGPARLMTMTSSAGEVTVRTWSDAVIKRNLKSDPAKSVTTFSLFAGSDPADPVKAFTLNGNAALFLRPEPMLVFCGTYPEIGEGALVMLARDRISGSGIRRLASVFSAEKPVYLDWQFGKRLSLSGEPGTRCTVNGKSVVLDQQGQGEWLDAAPACAGTWQNMLAGLRKRFAGHSVQEGSGQSPDRARCTLVTPLTEGLAFIRPVSEGFIAGAGRNFLIMDRQYGVRHRVSLASPVISGTEAGNCYIAGTRGEEIACISRDGRKIWSFTSRMAPEVTASHKYYWFKSVYPGVLSLEYRDGRIYAGGACTMEVLDPAGKLLRRYAQTWGPCRRITMISRQDGSHDAVGVRHDAADGVAMWCVNSVTGQNRRSYSENMPGYVHFPSFGSLYRTNAFAADFDGDGREELLTDAQGMYSWLNLYRADGTPLKQVNLGPGKVILQWTTGDLSGDGRPEAVVITWNRQLIALSGLCQPLWTADLPVEGRLLAVEPVRGAVAAAGKQELVVLDNRGRQTAFVRLPFAAEHLWCYEGAFYAASANGIYRIML